MCAMSRVDVRDEQSVAALFQAEHRELGWPEILMNNAGKGSGGAFLVDTSTGEFDAVVKTDLYGRSLAVGNSSGGVGPRTEVEKSSTSPPFTKRSRARTAVPMEQPKAGWR
jgi:NAD(P)-dependent dehydrogenase (short-subunit alcohol dehydrogenase family)